MLKNKAEKNDLKKEKKKQANLDKSPKLG